LHVKYPEKSCVWASKNSGLFVRILVFAVVAQLVEQHIRNVKVASSIPANGTKDLQQSVKNSIRSAEPA
jgi:hypothetical protein